MAAFELDGALASAIPELIVGPWRAAPGIASFDAATSVPESVWRVDLTRDLAASRSALMEGERSVAHTHAVLDDTPHRLEQALEHVLAERRSASRPGPAHAAHGAASREVPGAEASLFSPLPAHGHASPPQPMHAAYDADSPHLLDAASSMSSPFVPRGHASRPQSTRPERSTLVRELPTAESSLVAALAGTAVPWPQLESLAWSTDASGVPGPAEPGWLERALAQIADLARGRARIETRIEGILVAHSIMTLSGDTQLWIRPRLSRTDAMLHARSVAVAVRSRHAWARILTLIVRGGGRLATLGLAGIGPAALPLIWRFVRDLLREIRARDTRPSPQRGSL